MARGETFYRGSLSLLTDLYQLAMAYGHWKLGMVEKEGVFDLAFRRHPFAGGYTIACGLAAAIEYLGSLGFDQSDTEYLAALKGNDGRRLFQDAFLDYLRSMRFTCGVDAMPEGTVVFPHEPLLRVKGPMVQAQIIETPLLNLVNFQSLIATKSARICQAARGDAVIEFGLRRAQGIDGAMAASRAAYIGGCIATSNVLAGKRLGIPVKGTQSHSWIMSFDDELEAFEAFAQTQPNNCVLLVDTYDSLRGVRHALKVAEALRKRGQEIIGIRLDSGDLAYLSIEARRMLDEAGFPRASILASNELDEHVISSLKEQGARINAWGVGTRLVTGQDDPALGGVYKLTAVRVPPAPWSCRIKLSEQIAKISIPGIHQVRRFGRDGQFVADAIYDELTGIGQGCEIVDAADPMHRREIAPGTEHEDLLVPIFRGGKLVYSSPSLQQSQQRTARQIQSLHPTIRRLVNPHTYPAGLESRLQELRTAMVLDLRQAVRQESEP